MPRATTTKSNRSPAKSSRRGSSHTRTVVYDVAMQLRTPKEMAAYLEAWLVEAPDDAAGISRALGDIARAVGMSEVATQYGLSRESLYKALSKDGNPSLDTVLRVARAVGVRFLASAACGASTRASWNPAPNAPRGAIQFSLHRGSTDRSKPVQT